MKRLLTRIAGAVKGKKRRKRGVSVCVCVGGGGREVNRERIELIVKFLPGSPDTHLSQSQAGDHPSIVCPDSTR